MNKIPMKQDEILKIKEKESVIELKGEKNIQEIHFPQKNFKSTWIIKENASLNIECVTTLKDTSGTIEIICKENTTINIKLGIKAEGKNDLTIENKIEGNNNKSRIELRIVGEKNSESQITTTGIIKKDTTGNIFTEKVKYLNEEESKITCNPNLLVDTNDAQATHSASIAKISQEDLFYLESKGITEQNAKTLIRSCFLNSIKRKEGNDEY